MPQLPQVFMARSFVAFFPCAGTLGCAVCLTTWSFLPVCLHASEGLPATALPIQVFQPPLCHISSPPWLPVSAPCTGLDECFFFNSLVVRLLYSLIIWQFWVFFFLICCCPFFGCVRRQSVSTYASILSRSLISLALMFRLFVVVWCIR